MTTPAFDGTLTRDWMHRFADSVYATEAELTALDQRVGDGDFGTNLTAGVRAAGHLLDAGGAEAGPSETLGCMATAFLDEIGGTSGPLFGLLFQALSRSASGNGLTSAGLAEGVEQGLAAIRRVGDAAPGDKTLVDALTPAAAALRGASGGTPPDRALSLAADAAWQGVHDTAGLSARMGRASYLGERVTGIPDPGAVGVALLFASAAGPVHTLAPYLPGAG